LAAFFAAGFFAAFFAVFFAMLIPPFIVAVERLSAAGW
jgi:hypothetical protein